MPVRRADNPEGDANLPAQRGADPPGAQDTAELLRELAPQVLSALARRYGQFGACEDAVQEAMLEAVATWPDRGLPQSPKGWLVTVASRRLIDEVRSEHARRRREQDHAATSPGSARRSLAAPCSTTATGNGARTRRSTHPSSS